MTQIQFPTKAQADAAYAPITGIPESAVTGLVSDLAAKAPLASPTFTGTVTVPTTVNATDAAQKAYVDAVVQGLSPKPSAVVATAAALPTNTYLAGVLTGSATGTLTVDGHLVALNEYVLVKNEASQANNGLYKCTTAGAVGVAYVLTRAVEMDSSTEFVGSFVFIEQGTVNASSGWVCTNTSNPTVGTTAITFTQFSGAGEITAGTGLSKTGNTLAIDTGTTVDKTTSQTLTGKTMDYNSNTFQNFPGGSAELFDSVSKSANYTIIDPTDKGKAFLCTAGLTLTLPAASNKFWFVVYNNSTTGYVQVGSTIVVFPGEVARIASDGTSWFVLDSRLDIATYGKAAARVTLNAADDYWIEAALDTGGTRFGSANAWTWNNQGGATIDFIGSGYMVIKDPANASTSMRQIEQSLPGSGSWTYQVKVALQSIDTQFMRVGLSLRESSSGKLETIEILNSGGPSAIANNKWNSTTAFNGSYTAFNNASYGPVYLRFLYDGTNINASFSLNGTYFSPLSSHTPGTFFTTTPDKVGLICLSNTSNIDTYAVFNAFQRIA